MPRWVLIASNVLFGLLAAVLLASLYYNVHLVFSGRVEQLSARLVPAGEGAFETEYRVTIRRDNGDGLGTYIVSDQDASRLRYGDRITARRRGGERIRVLRVRHPNLVELILESERIVEGTVMEVTRPAGRAAVRVDAVWKPEAQGAAARSLRPGAVLDVGLGLEHYPLPAAGGDALYGVYLEPEERALFFLDGDDELLAGPAAVVRLQNERAYDLELGLDTSAQALRRQVRRILADAQQARRVLSGGEAGGPGAVQP